MPYRGRRKNQKSALPAALLLPLRPQPGHKSLLDCFASKHGSGCGTCIYEDFYTFEQSGKGKSAAEIRAGIIKESGNRSTARSTSSPCRQK